MRADPQHADAWSNLGNTLAGAGRYADAEAAYRSSLRARPAPEASNNLANVLALRGDVPAALELYATALALDPSYVDAHRNRAEVLLASGRAAEACDGFAAALRLQPRLVEAVTGRVRCLAALGRRDDALAAGRAALVWAGDSEALRAALASLGDVAAAPGAGSTR